MNIIERICWNITSECNENCKFCFRKKHQNELTFEQQKRAIDILSDCEIKHITFSGGEALLVKNLLNLIEYCKSKHFSVNLITNGKILDKELISKIYDKIDSISLPIDNINTTMLINGKPVGRQSEQLYTIEKCLKLLSHYPNLQVKINTVATKFNYLHIIDIYDKIIKDNNQISKWNIFEFTPLRDDAKNNRDLFELSKNEFQDLKDILVARKNNNGFRKNLSIRVKSKYAICKSYLVIMPNGDFVVDDESDEEYVVANIFDSNLKKLLNNLQLDFEIYKKRQQVDSLIIV